MACVYKWMGVCICMTCVCMDVSDCVCVCVYVWQQMDKASGRIENIFTF